MGVMKNILIILLFWYLFGVGLPASTQVASFDETGRLAMLARAWGFLKYYHPQKDNTFSNWDESLIRAIPMARLARNREEFSDVVVQLIQEAGGINPFTFTDLKPGPTPDEPLYAWMDDDKFISPRVSLLLNVIRSNCRGPNSLTLYQPGTNIILAEEEEPYNDELFPSEEIRLLSLFRFWNVIHHFFPYKSLMDRPWDDKLLEMIPVFIQTANRLEYALAVRELTAGINDSHAFLVSNTLDSEYWGKLYPPFISRTVEKRIVVVKVLESQPDGVQTGDVVLALDTKSVEELRTRHRKYIQASNEAYFERAFNGYLFRGTQTALTLTVERNGRQLTIPLSRITASRYTELKSAGPVLPMYRWLENNIGYVDMGLLTGDKVDRMMDELISARAIIFDSRNYPNWTIYQLAERLNPKAVPFVRFTYPDSKRPGFFTTSRNTLCGPSQESNNHYKGKVVILFNEETLSQAEFTCMALQTAPDAVSIGSQTAGADGNVTQISLPGGLLAYFTGLGVYYPDGRETQRIGIVPDILVTPTINGIRKGIDEVLEQAIEHIEANVN